MIFDIYGKQINGQLIFELPYHQFKLSEKIALRRVIIDWKTKEKCFAVIKTNLVDLGPCNPKRQILSLAKQTATTVTDVQISDPVLYPIQIDQLENASITIEPMFDKAVPQIKNIYLQIESV